MTMIGICRLLVMLAVTVCITTACKIRKVDIVMEIGPNGHASALKFRRSLEEDDKSKDRCWEANIALIYSSQIREKKSVRISVQAKNTGWRDSTVQLLRNLKNSVGNTLQSHESSPVVVLVLSSYDLSVDKLSSAAKELQELGFKLVTVGVGDGWSVEKLKPISNSKNRILFANDLSELSRDSDLSINKRLVDLLDDPNKEGSGMTGPLRSDMVFNPLGPSAIFQDLLMQPQPQAVPEKKKCRKIVDLGFILDSSGSLKMDYGKEKDFVKLIARAFNIQYGGSHAGVVTFSHEAELSIRLSETTTYEEFERAVDRIPHMNSITRIDLALEKAKDELFLDLNGGRDGVKKVLVLLTDGGQSVVKSGVKDHIAIAEQLRREGVELLIIGIGEQADEVDLERLAGPNDNYRKAADFKELASIEFATKMTTKLCETATDDKCRQIVDVSFMIDSSGSIDKQTDWVTIKDFVRRLANVFQFSETGAHGSVVVFSDLIDDKHEFTKVVLQLNNKLTATEFGKSVQAIPYFGYRTRIDLGFKLVKEKVFQPKYGARGKNVKKVIVLITDGKQNPEKYDPIEASRQLYEDGVNIYAIGIGKEIDFDQLKAITRVPHRVFHADSFDTLEKYVFVNNVSNTVCHNATRPPPEVKDCCCPKLNQTFKENLGKRLVNVVTEEMDKYCKGKCDKSSKTLDSSFDTFVQPGYLGIRSNRMRRSVDHRVSAKEDVIESGISKMLQKFSNEVGCNTFFDALQKYGYLNKIKELKVQSKHVTLFCPIDAAYEKIYEHGDVKETDVLKRHVGIEEGEKYFTLQSGHEVTIGNVPNKVSKQANGIEILYTFRDAENEVIILKDILQKKQNNLLDILKINANVSIFYEIMVQTNLLDVFRQTEVDKVCFVNGLCFSTTSAILNELRNTIRNQYTILAPTNMMLSQKNKFDIKSIMTKPTARDEFLQQFVYVGKLGALRKQSVVGDTSLLSARREEKVIITGKGGAKYEVKETVAVNEGLLYVVDAL